MKCKLGIGLVLLTVLGSMIVASESPASATCRQPPLAGEVKNNTAKTGTNNRRLVIHDIGAECAPYFAFEWSLYGGENSVSKMTDTDEFTAAIDFFTVWGVVYGPYAWIDINADNFRCDNTSVPFPPFTIRINCVFTGV
jgi:hypothetical protein